MKSCYGHFQDVSAHENTCVAVVKVKITSIMICNKLIEVSFPSCAFRHIRKTGRPGCNSLLRMKPEIK